MGLVHIFNFTRTFAKSKFQNVWIGFVAGLFWVGKKGIHTSF